MPFSLPVVPAAAPEPTPTLIEKIQENQSLYLNGAALVFAFVIGFLALRSVKQTRTTSRSTALATTHHSAGPPSLTGQHSGMPLIEESPIAPRMVPELAAMQANSETRNRVTATVDQQPEIAAKMVRAWMKEA